jgi:hypothetical protein
MSVTSLTPQEKDLLISVSYLDLPSRTRVSENSQLSLNDFLSELSNSERKEQADRYVRLTTYLDEHPNSTLHDMKLYAYQNHNPNGDNNSRGSSDSGFVGYAFTFEGHQEEAVVLYRGSEQGSLPDFWADWGSNAASAVGFEITQQEEANKFYQDFVKDKRLGDKLLISHSKGGNVNAYTNLHNPDDKNLTSYILNGQPLAWWSLDDVDDPKKALSNTDRFQFVATVGDAVHKLGDTPYDTRRIGIIPKWGDPIWAHSELSIAYDDGNHIKPIIEERNLLSDISDIGHIVGNIGVLIGQKVVSLGKKAVKAGYEILVSVRDAALNAIHKAKQGLEAAAHRIIDGTIRFVSGVRHVGEQIKKEINSLLVKVKNKINLIVAKIGGHFGASFPVEPIIKVNLQRVDYYIQRLQAIKRKTADFNQRIDSLYWEVGISGFDNVVKADILTSFNFRINQNISYLTTVASLIERTESRLAAKARSLH